MPPVFGMIQSSDLAGLKEALAADPTLVDLDGPSGVTPLAAALSGKNMEAVRVLLAAGADPNKPFGQARMHPLQAAVFRGLTDAIDALLARGADPNGKDANGGTALHEAAIKGFVEIASLLAGKGADVDAQYTQGPNAGATPVHLAAKNNNVPLMIVLAAHQPKWNLKWNGRTPAEVADDSGSKDVAEYIRARQAEKK